MSPSKVAGPPGAHGPTVSHKDNLVWVGATAAWTALPSLHQAVRK
jgi:hypothetical protein